MTADVTRAGRFIKPLPAKRKKGVAALAQPAAAFHHARITRIRLPISWTCTRIHLWRSAPILFCMRLLAKA